MKGGVTKRIEDTISALEKGQLKQALYLTDRSEMGRENTLVREAARKALDDRDNAKTYMLEARDKLKATITAPLDDTSLEGVEEMLNETRSETEPKSEMTDEELFEACEECHVAVAAARFADICAEHPEEAHAGCKLVSEKLEDENTAPADWIKAMVETAEEAEGPAKTEMAAAITELTDYLQRRESPLLKELDKGDEGGGLTPP